LPALAFACCGVCVLWRLRSVLPNGPMPLCHACHVNTQRHAINTPYHTTLYHATACHAIQQVTPCHAVNTPYHTTLCHATPCHATPRHAMPASCKEISIGGQKEGASQAQYLILSNKSRYETVVQLGCLKPVALDTAAE
jgi:hypothetical protein